MTDAVGEAGVDPRDERDFVRDLVLAGGGVSLVAQFATDGAEAFLRAAAESGRAGDVRILDLAGPGHRQARYGRDRLRVLDLDALADDAAFLGDLATCLDHAPIRLASAVAQRDPPAYWRSRPWTEVPAGPWDRAVRRLGLPATRAEMLLGDLMPGLDGTTPVLGEGDLAGGLLLVLVPWDAPFGGDAGRIRAAIGALAVGNLLLRRAAGGDVAVAFGEGCPEIRTCLPGAFRDDPATACRSPRLRFGSEGRGLAIVPAGAPPIAAPEDAASHPGGIGPVAGAFGTAWWRLRLGHGFVDRTGWASAFRDGPGAPEGGVVMRRLADGAALPGRPWPLPKGRLPPDDEPGSMLDLLFPPTPPPEGERALLEGLDAELLRACERSGGGSMLHAWTMHGDRARRRQFVLTWDRLADLGRQHGLGGAVDRGEPSLPLVAAAAGLCEARTRRIYKGRGGIRVGRDLNLFLAFLRGTPLDALPAAGHRAGWTAYAAMVEFAADLLGPDPVGHPCFRGACAFLGRGGRGGWDGWTRLSTGVVDVAIGLARLADMVDPRVGTAVAASVLLDVPDWDALGRLSLAWHADPVLAMGDAAWIGDGVSWPPLFEGEVELDDDLTAVALASVASLVDEGARGPDASGMDGLGHCVASYAGACRRGGCAIVSIRRTVGDRTVRVSTAEIVRDGDALRVVQHRGFGNADPAPDAAAALDVLMAMLEAGAVGMVDGSLARADGHGSGPEGAPPAEILDDLARRWARILPKPWRHRTFPGLAAAFAARADALGLAVARAA